MFGRRQRGDDRDGAHWDQGDGRSEEFADPWADMRDKGPVNGDGYRHETDDDPAGNNGSNGQRRGAGPGPGGPPVSRPGMNGQGFRDAPWEDPRPARPDPEDGPFARRSPFNERRPTFRANSRDDFRDDPRDALGDRPRDAFRDDPRDVPGDRPRDAFRDDPRDALGDRPRDAFRDDPRNGFRDDPRDGLGDRPRDGLRDGPRSGFRDDPRDGLGDRPRDGLRDNGGPGGRHSSARPDRRERDAEAWAAPEPEMPIPEFTPAAIAPPVLPVGVGNSRPVGRVLIYTLREDRAAEFDRLAEEAAEGVRMAEPDTLVYIYHTVPTLPAQRIIYEVYRDRAAFESHQRQPHIQRFTDEVKSCVTGSNVIDLRLKYAKVAPLQGAGQPAAGGLPAALPPAQPQPVDGQPAGPSFNARRDAEQTARHRAPRPLEAAGRPGGDDRNGNWFGDREQAGPAGGGRRGEPSDDWSPGRDWGRT